MKSLFIRTDFSMSNNKCNTSVCEVSDDNDVIKQIDAAFNVSLIRMFSSIASYSSFGGRVLVRIGDDITAVSVKTLMDNGSVKDYVFSNAIVNKLKSIGMREEYEVY